MSASISKRMHVLMEKHALSQRDMAELLGIANTSTFRYLHGQAVPKGDKHKQIDERLRELEATDSVVGLSSFAGTRRRGTAVKAEVKAETEQPSSLRGRFVNARVHANMSWMRAAEILGCSVGAMSDFEAGKDVALKVEDLEAFIEMYGERSDVDIVDIEDINEDDTITLDEILRTVQLLAESIGLDPGRARIFLGSFLQFTISEGMSFTKITELLCDANPGGNQL